MSILDRLFAWLCILVVIAALFVVTREKVSEPTVDGCEKITYVFLDGIIRYNVAEILCPD